MRRNLEDCGREIQLETYKAMNRTELLDGPLMAAILAGVSARRYASIVVRGLQAKGVKRSSISRKSIAATKQAFWTICVVTRGSTSLGGFQPSFIAKPIKRNRIGNASLIIESRFFLLTRIQNTTFTFIKQAIYKQNDSTYTGMLRSSASDICSIFNAMT